VVWIFARTIVIGPDCNGQHIGLSRASFAVSVTSQRYIRARDGAANLAENSSVTTAIIFARSAGHDDHEPETRSKKSTISSRATVAIQGAEVRRLARDLPIQGNRPPGKVMAAMMDGAGDLGRHRGNVACLRARAAASDTSRCCR
jgi:hypothetical protein